MRRRRRRRKKPIYPPLTRIAAHLYLGCFDERMPRGWRVEFAGFMRGALGLCIPNEKRVLLSFGDFRKACNDPLQTLVHEFIHIRFPSLRHGQEFRRLESHALANLWAKTEELDA